MSLVQTASNRPTPTFAPDKLGRGATVWSGTVVTT